MSYSCDEFVHRAAEAVVIVHEFKADVRVLFGKGLAVFWWDDVIMKTVDDMSANGCRHTNIAEDGRFDSLKSGGAEHKSTYL